MEISENTIIKNVVKSNIAVVGNAELSIAGIVNGDINILDNSKCFITGIVNGTINVSKSSELIINGIINGSIVNNGATTISGIANLQTFSGNKLIVKAKAIINNVTYESDTFI